MTSAGKSETLAMGTYRLRKAFAAVHFDQADGKGRIVILPKERSFALLDPPACANVTRSCSRTAVTAYSK